MEIKKARVPLLKGGPLAIVRAVSDHCVFLFVFAAAGKNDAVFPLLFVLLQPFSAPASAGPAEG